MVKKPTEDQIRFRLIEEIKELETEIYGRHMEAVTLKFNSVDMLRCRISRLNEIKGEVDDAKI